MCDVLLPSSPSFSLTPTPSPQPLCDFVNCSGNGDCIDLEDNLFTCDCFPGWTGMFCDVPLISSSFAFTLTPTPSPSPLICDSVNCNNGTCVADDLGINFTCQCFVGWTGEVCDVPLPPSPSFTLMPSPSPEPPLSICDFVNCSGNGECIDLVENFECSCYVGWTGPECEDDIDFCQPDKFGNCSQMGTDSCIDGNSTHTCTCLQGFTGDLCSVDIDDCDPDPCFSNATCIDLPLGMFICECLPGFTGALCNESFSPCEPNPCKEPDEVCIVTGFGGDDFTCIVPPTTTEVDTPTTTLVAPSTTSVDSTTLSSSTVFITSTVSSSPVLVSSTPIPIPTPIPPNSHPVVINPIGTLLANEGQVTHFTIPEMTFHDQESGTTGNLRLSLLDSSGGELANTTWIHLTNGAIQALPLRDQATVDFVTEYTFILRAADERGASTHDFVTVRVLRQQEDFQNFLVVLFEGSFVTFSQNIVTRITLTQRLSAHISGISVTAVLSTPNIYVRAFRNGSIAVVYRDISILDTHCADFRAWVATVYADSNFMPNFIQSLQPFVPTSEPVIEGPCNITETNPTVVVPPERVPLKPRSDLILFLASVIPTIVVACLCLAIGILLFANYRSRRSERNKLTSRAMERTFTHRRPVVLDEEWDLPNRRRRPIVLPSDRTLVGRDPTDDGHGRRLLLEEVDYGAESESSEEEELMTAPGLTLARRNRYAMMSPDPPIDEGPPPYVLPPL